MYNAQSLTDTQTVKMRAIVFLVTTLVVTTLGDGVGHHGHHGEHHGEHHAEHHGEHHAEHHGDHHAATPQKHEPHHAAHAAPQKQAPAPPKPVVKAAPQPAKHAAPHHAQHAAPHHAAPHHAVPHHVAPQHHRKPLPPRPRPVGFARRPQVAHRPRVVRPRLPQVNIFLVKCKYSSLICFSLSIHSTWLSNRRDFPMFPDLSEDFITTSLTDPLSLTMDLTTVSGDLTPMFSPVVQSSRFTINNSRPQSSPAPARVLLL